MGIIVLLHNLGWEQLGWLVEKFRRNPRFSGPVGLGGHNWILFLIRCCHKCQQMNVSSLLRVLDPLLQGLRAPPPGTEKADLFLLPWAPTPIFRISRRVSLPSRLGVLPTLTRPRRRLKILRKCNTGLILFVVMFCNLFSEHKRPRQASSSVDMTFLFRLNRCTSVYLSV